MKTFFQFLHEVTLHGKTWYHGTRDDAPTDPKKLNPPIFLTSSQDAAEWYANNRFDDTKPMVYVFKVDVHNPFDVQDLDGLADILRKAGIDVEWSPGGMWNVPEVSQHSGYEGDNELDVVYIPKARAALLKAGYDALYSSTDPVTHDAAEALVPLKHSAMTFVNAIKVR
jgi:hypothetical protein